MAKDLNEITFPIASANEGKIKDIAKSDAKVAEVETLAVGRGKKRKMYATLRWKSHDDMMHIARIVDEYKASDL